MGKLLLMILSSAEAATYTVWLNYEQQGRPPRLSKSDDQPTFTTGPADRVVSPPSYSNGRARHLWKPVDQLLS